MIPRVKVRRTGNSWSVYVGGELDSRWTTWTVTYSRARIVAHRVRWMLE